MAFGEVVALGARGPLGFASLPVVLAARARKLEPRPTRILDKRGEPIAFARTGGLADDLHGYERLVALAAPALAEAEAARPHKGQPLPLVLCLPERHRADDDPRLTTGFLPDLAARSGVRLDPRSVAVRMGHAGFAHALLVAEELLDEGKEAVCVGGVDSYYHPELLQWLDREFRVAAAGGEEGFVPSEAAAFVVLARSSERSLGRVLDVETSEELAAAADDEPNIGLAMALMLESVTKRAGKVRWAFSDDNGEKHRRDEWTKAQKRGLPGELVDGRIVWATGDVGAASGALFAVIALELIGLGCGVASKILLALHSIGKERGLVALEGVRRG